MSCGDFGFTCEVVHVPRNAAASSKKRPTVPHRHPRHHFCAPTDRFMGGAVARCCFLAKSEYRQKREKNAKETVLFPPENQPWGPKGAYMMQDFVPGMDLMGSTGYFSDARRPFFSPGQCDACPGDNVRAGTSREAGLLVFSARCGVGRSGLHSRSRSLKTSYA
jgi:hypothetical protein